MHELKLYDYFMYIIFRSDNEEIYERGLSFFLDIYNAKDNEIEDIHNLFQIVLK